MRLDLTLGKTHEQNGAALLLASIGIYSVLS
jgi:hypothetical protein